MLTAYPWVGPNGYVLLREPFLDCYWVGSLDFNFLDSLHMSFYRAKSDSLFAGGSTTPKISSWHKGKPTAQLFAWRRLMNPSKMLGHCPKSFGVMDPFLKGGKKKEKNKNNSPYFGVASSWWRG